MFSVFFSLVSPPNHHTTSPFPFPPFPLCTIELNCITSINVLLVCVCVCVVCVSILLYCHSSSLLRPPAPPSAGCEIRLQFSGVACGRVALLVPIAPGRGSRLEGGPVPLTLVPLERGLEAEDAGVGRQVVQLVLQVHPVVGLVDGGRRRGRVGAVVHVGGGRVGEMVVQRLVV